MKHSILVFCLLLLSACASSPKTEYAAPALWKLSDEDSNIWIFGSFHALPADLEWVHDAFEAAYAESDTIMFETPLHGEAVAEMAQLLQMHGTANDGVRLQERLNPAYREKLADAAITLGAPVSSFDTYRPWLAALVLSVAQAGAHGFDPAQGVERFVLTRAKTDGKDFDALESPEEHVGVFTSMGPDAELRFLETTLDDFPNARRILVDLASAWLRADFDRLELISDASYRDGGEEIREIILIRRNRNWADALQTRLEGEGAALVVVGAAHLVGEDSLIELLQDRGLSVVRQ